MSAQETYRDAAIAASCAMAPAGLAPIFLPMERGHHDTLLRALLEDHGDRVRVVGAVFVLAIPALLALATLLYKSGKGPPVGLRVAALVVALPIVALPIVAYVADAGSGRGGERFSAATAVAWAVTALAIVAWARGLRGERWKAWAHALAAAGMGLASSLAFIAAANREWESPRILGPGTSVLVVCIAALLPIGLYVLIPRKS